MDEEPTRPERTERYQVFDDETPITTWKLGSILSGGGSTPAENTPEAWADMVDRFQRAALDTRLGIPLLYGIDAVDGNGNALGATVFPHNIGLGATRDARLVREIAEITAEETRASGPQWTFSPCICAARDDRWGRTYESFSEDPGLVIRMESAIDGYQGGRGDLDERDHMLATARHYAGDGDTEYGTASGDYKIDQGIAITGRRDFWDASLRQYVPAVRDHRVGSVMPSFSSVDWTEDGVGNPIKMHANRELISDVLKDSIGFGGFVISDWEGIHQIPGDWPTQVRTGVNAGIDMMMEPNAYQSFITTLLDEVRAGRVPMSRIDDSVRRILTKKFELGLFERPFTDRRNVCAAAKRCVVVIVSGRPLIVDPERLAEIDALVAAWLPGSEGAGVADTLFGERPFTGKLPMSWPRTLDQEPINVGDADYDPLYPYGYGLRTSREEDD
jgi:beta-glucosidase